MSEQEQNKVALVIIAHPDDAEFGCAGTVALWAREGWDVRARAGMCTTCCVPMVLVVVPTKPPMSG